MSVPGGPKGEYHSAQHEGTPVSGAAQTDAERAAALAELWRELQADPTAFDFFALMRRVDALRPNDPRTGEALRPRQEALRLAQAAEMDFAPAPLHRLELRDGAAPRLTVRFFGLLGPHGPMPGHFTEFVRERQRHHDDATLAHFLDIFHHRLLTLFHRAWASAQPVVHLDRPADDGFSRWLAACAGTPAHTGALPMAALHHHAGWLSARSRHPEMLHKVLGQFFGVPVRIEEQVGHWLPIDPNERSRLGFARNRDEHTQVPAARLGRTANAGSRVWDRQSRFRLHLGPLSWAQYTRFLPGGSAWLQLLHAVQLLAGREMLWDLQLHLSHAERPTPRLGRHNKALRLGVSSWLAAPATPSKPGLQMTKTIPHAGPGPSHPSSAVGQAGQMGQMGPNTPIGHHPARGLRLRPLTSFLLQRPLQPATPHPGAHHG